MKKKNKKPLFALLLVAVLGVVGVTFAYFTTTDTFENIFSTATYKTEVVETFTSPENWTPGTVTDKTIEVTNKGDVGVAVRVSFEEKWTAADGTDLPLTDTDGNKAAIIHLNEGSWSKSTESGIDYYYYKYQLKPNEEISPYDSLIQSVEFNQDVAINSTTDCSTSADGTTKTCISTLSSYAGATYTLTIKVETAQYDQYQNIWNTSVDIREEYIPIPG